MRRMRIAVISDLHANLPALRAVVDDAARIGCDGQRTQSLPAGVEELLDVGERRLSRRLVHRGHHAVVPLRKRRHHDESLR